MYFNFSILLYLLLFLFNITTTFAMEEPQTGKGLPSYLFSEKFIMENKEEIGLTKEQIQTILDLTTLFKKDEQTIKEQLFIESQKLNDLLAKFTIDEKVSMEIIESMLNIDLEKKKHWILFLIRIKNTLNEDQQEKLIHIREKVKQLNLTK